MLPQMDTDQVTAYCLRDFALAMVMATAGVYVTLGHLLYFGNNFRINFLM